MKIVITSFVISTLLLFVKTTTAQTTDQLDLVQLYQTKKLIIHNREVSTETNNGKNAIVLNLQEGEGIAWVKDVAFSKGTIEVDLRGQDIFQHSFLGIAFHGQDDDTFEAIYFRPFQFRSTDPVRNARGVQYINLPLHTWQRLREEQPGKFENVVKPVPDPDNWFHLRMVVSETEVQVYVNDAGSPCLKVPLLSKNKNGRIGLYTADQSGGSFANLVIRNE